MPTAEVKFYDRNESLCRIIHHRHWQKCLGVLHEAVVHQNSIVNSSHTGIHMVKNDPDSWYNFKNILGNPLQHALRFQDKSR